MASSFPDPFDYVRRELSRAAARALDRAIAQVRAAARNAVNRRLRSLADQIQYFTAVLGRLPHGMANVVADAFRGLFARRLTAAETSMVDFAFGTQPVRPSDVRIVAGSGSQPLAATAFLNGNPAITIGNTIYIKTSVYRDLKAQNLAAHAKGIEMLVHEYTHVVQYARLGFAAFGARYAREFHQSGYDANEMYDYKSRTLHYDIEMIEGQAAIAGDFAEQMALPAAERNNALVNQLRSKLRGSGVMGQ